MTQPKVAARLASVAMVAALARVQPVVAPADGPAHQHGRMRHPPPDLVRLARDGVEQKGEDEDGGEAHNAASNWSQP